MSGILTALKYLCADLLDLDVPWALIGAMAVGVYTEPRTTRDIDIAISADKEKHQDLINTLIKRGYQNEQLLMHSDPAHIMGTRLEVRGGHEIFTAVDFLFSSSGIEAEVVASAVKLEIFPGLHVPIACRGHLIAMKVISQNDTDRARDLIDLRNLLFSANLDDITIAENALDLVSMRGYNRSKDLRSDFNKIRSKASTRLSGN